jgi:hypothetical protein
MFLLNSFRRKVMKVSNLRLLPIALLALGLVIGYAPPGYAAHPGGAVSLRDAAGNFLTAGTSTVPYSPKKTCAVAGCHTSYVTSGGTAVYENTTGYATKDHGAGGAYQVPYPQHGVTAGYHFQQGRNLDWSDAQREFFHQAAITSSGGMVGKY